MKRFGPKLRKNRCIFICKTDVNLILIDLSSVRRVHCLILSNTGLFKIDFLLEVKSRDRGSGVLSVQVAPLCAGPSPGLFWTAESPSTENTRKATLLPIKQLLGAVLSASCTHLTGQQGFLSPGSLYVLLQKPWRTCPLGR